MAIASNKPSVYPHVQQASMQVRDVNAALRIRHDAVIEFPSFSLRRSLVRSLHSLSISLYLGCIFVRFPGPVSF